MPLPALDSGIPLSLIPLLQASEREAQRWRDHAEGYRELLLECLSLMHGMGREERALRDRLRFLTDGH